MLCAVYLASFIAISTHLSTVKEEKINSLNFIVSEILTRTCEQALWRGTDIDLVDISKSLISSSAIHSITVLDEDNNLFFFLTKDHKKIKGITVLEDINRKSISNINNKLEFDAVDTLPKIIRLGQLRVVINEEEINDFAWNDIWVKFSLMISLALFVIPLFFVLSMSLMRPLKAILIDLKKFENGGYKNLESADYYNDEYSKISKAMKKAGASIAVKTKEIEETNAALQVRTQQLEHQYDVALAAVEQADEANARKDIFVKNISHELKTPLTGVVAALDLIEQSINSLAPGEDGVASGYESQKRFQQDLMQLLSCIELARYSGDQLESLVSEILMSIQDMYSEIVINRKPVALLPSILKLIEEHRSTAIHKGLSFNLILDEEFDVWVNADWMRITQVLNSILNNAVRFTEVGKIDVKVKVSNTTDKVILYIEVCDTGVGISQSEKERIFSLFHIGEEPTVKQLSGIGMGLSIAQRVCLSMGGELALKSTSLGNGSCFSFYVEFEKCLPTYTEAPVEDKKTLSIISDLKLLYIEDSLTNQLIFKEYCSRENVDLVLASNGREGLEKFRHGKYDGVIVDCYMPVMNGYELVEEIRKLEIDNNFERSFIVALTADDTKVNRQKCHNSGFDEFISKPYTRPAFVRILSEVSVRKARSIN